MCAFSPRRTMTHSLFPPYTHSNTKTMHISRLMAAAFILVPILPPLWQTTALTAVVAPSGSSWCLVTATVPWRLHIGHGALCDSLVFVLTFSGAEQRFGPGWRGAGQVPWGWHRARRPWQTGDLGFVTSSATSGHHGIRFPYCLMNEDWNLGSFMQLLVMF